jgi:arylsulfatase A-like enzyme
MTNAKYKTTAGLGRSILQRCILICLLAGLVSGAPAKASEPTKPNIIFILVDDMGYSDLGSYGGEVQTPNLDQLAENGMRFTQMYNTAKCFPSRACLLTGVYAQESGMAKRHGAIQNAVTLGEVLRTAGYRTWASGKHHGTENLYDRGFDHYYGLRHGASNMWNPGGVTREGEMTPGRKGSKRPFCIDEQTIEPYTPPIGWYATDAFTDYALKWLEEPAYQEDPFFLYLSYTAPHYPLHAWPEDIAKYKGRYDAGYTEIQKERYQRMVDMQLIDPTVTPFTPLDDSEWNQLSGIELEKEKLRMEIYAAMIDRVDQNIGRILDTLRAQGKLENTLIMFASDNGGCAAGTGAKVKSSDINEFGKVGSYEAVGKNWATVQNTPLRYWKNYSHEGGINTPFIVSWPDGIKEVGGFYREPAHFIDIMATLVEITGASYPETFNDQNITPVQGISLLPAFENESLNRTEPLFWQWGKGGAIRDGKMKAVILEGKWELFDVAKDRNESNDLSLQYPEKLERLKQMHAEWYASTASGKSRMVGLQAITEKE